MRRLSSTMTSRKRMRKEAEENSRASSLSCKQSLVPVLQVCLLAPDRLPGTRGLLANVTDHIEEARLRER